MRVRIFCRLAMVGALVWLLQPGAGPLAALVDELSDRDIARALNLANASEVQRKVFHAPYLVAVGSPLVEHIEIVTPFRRFVLAAEEELQAGRWMIARGGYDRQGESLKDRLRSSSGQVSVRARLRFHPHNTYVHLPPIDILVGEPSLLAIDVTRTPHVTPASGDGLTREVIHGATIETWVNAPSVGNNTLPVRVVVEGAEAARVRVDFSRLE